VAIRKGKWKGIRRDLKNNPENPLELYDLEKDTAELINVADKHPDVVRELSQLILKSRTPSKMFPFPALDSISFNIE
jgi:arylsulfatase A-like enzyme